MRGRVVEARDETERPLAHRLQHAVVGQVAGADQLDTRLLQTALLVPLDEGDRLAPRRDEHEHRLRLRVLDSLQIRREVRVLQRRAHAVDHLAAGGLERLHECALGVDAGTVVGYERVGALDPVLRGPLRDRLRVLRQRVRDAHDVGRACRDDRRRRVHDHHRLLRLRVDRRHRERIRRQPEAGEDVDAVARDQLLREALRDLGRGARRVARHDLDLLPAERFAVQLQVRLHPVVDLRAVIGERTREFGDHADFHRLLPHGRRDPEEGQRNETRGQALPNLHPHLFTLLGRCRASTATPASAALRGRTSRAPPARRRSPRPPP